MYFCNYPFFSDSGCFEGYKLIPGDIPGDGQIQGGVQTDEEGCARICHFNKDCCSFEQSLSENLCNMNNDCKPTTGANKGFKFCVKGECVNGVNQK